MRLRFAPYAASFAFGCRAVFHNRGDVAGRLAIFGVLMAMFSAIYGIMPLEKLGLPGLTASHMLWYFAVTETIIVGAQHEWRGFGRAIAEGQLTVMMQRPADMMGLTVARQMGAYAAAAAILIAAACVIVPLLTGAPPPLSWPHIPLLILSMALGGIIILLLGYIVSMTEVLGPYSMPASWIVGKLLFAFGGLFFPVQFFPDGVRAIVMLTPFPAALHAANAMLGESMAALLRGMGVQCFWIAVLFMLARCAESRMLRRVMAVGD